MGERFGTRFFSPLLPGFSEKLLIPDELVKHICMNKNRRAATIVTSNAKIWHVELYREMDDMYIGGEGWKNFVKAFDLRDFDMLIFRYRGNMVFTLRVFDQTTRCEKIVKENTIFSDHDGHQNSNFVQKPSKCSHKKRKGEDSSLISNSEDSTTLRSRDQVAKEAKINDTKELTFETTIKDYNLTRRNKCMKIPSDFLDAAGGLLQCDELMLSDSTGKTWQVGLYKCITSSNIYMSKGWRNFSRSNKLKEGDRCIFELLPSSSSGKKRSMNVKILDRDLTRQIDDEMRESSSKDLTTSPHLQPSKPSENDNTSNFMTEAHFEVTFVARRPKPYCVYVPKRFIVSTGIGKLRELILIDPKGRHWPVHLSHFLRTRGTIDSYFTWRQFALCNYLQEGDRCILESLPDKDNNVIRVRIPRKMKETQKK